MFRSVPMGTFNPHYPLKEVSRAKPRAQTKSAPPPKHKPNYAERHFGAQREAPLTRDQIRRMLRAEQACELFRKR